MAHQIVMPSFGMYTAEGNLGRWLRPAGSRVEAGEVIADLVTEKATYELEAPAAGLLHPVAVEGESLQVEGLIGWILAEGEAAPEAPRGTSPSSSESASATAAEASLAPGGEPAADRDEGASVGPTEAAAEQSGERPRASPIARRIAAERGIDLATIAGTGPGGRIVEADVLAAAASPALDRRAVEADAAAPSASVDLAKPEVPWRVRERLPLSGARKTIGQRLRRTLDTAVSLTLTREARAEALVAARASLAERLGIDLPFDALLLKVFAAALRERPDLHAVIAGGEILLLDEMHLGFAASVPSGLVVPVVQDVDTQPLAAVAAKVRELAQRARDGALRPQDLLGGTATLTNLGAYGIDAFTPVLNPPQSVILGVGRIALRPVVEDGQIAVGTTCVLSLTFDHRVADGAPAAELLGAVARRIADPAFFGGLA